MGLLILLAVGGAGFALGRGTSPDESAGTTNRAGGSEQVAEPADNAKDASENGTILLDPMPVIAEFHRVLGKTITVRHVVLYPEDISMTVQDPERPRHLDDYLFINGAMQPARPVSVSRGEDFTDELFSLEGVPFEDIPEMVVKAKRMIDLENPETSYVSITRGALDGPIELAVYVDDPVRGGGGYVLFGADGSVLRDADGNVPVQGNATPPRPDPPFTIPTRTLPT